MTNSHQTLYQIALTKIANVGGVIARALVGHCGGAEAVFREKAAHLRKIPGVGPRIARQITRPDVLQLAERELTFVTRHQIDVHFFLDPTYPRRLTHYQQSPVLLYSKGEMDLNPLRVIAVVGTREPTAYGKQMCREFIHGLAAMEVTIISGLAYGIDIEAHVGAMTYDMPTVGVLGSGFGHIYPQAHFRKAQRMMQNGGLLTEFGYESGPDKENFPARNRIVAGMVDAVVVIESAESGGSMITAEFANAYHKDVFALPGRAGDRLSSGCHKLIKSHKAHLMDKAHDLTSMMQWDVDEEEAGSVQRMLFADLNEREQLIVDLLDRQTETDIDKLAYSAGLPASELATVLLSLEFKGIVRTLPGKRYHIV